MHHALQSLTFRAAREADRTLLQKLWEASQDADDPVFRPRTGWWSLAAWATQVYLLVEDAPIGAVGVKRAADGVAEVRLALLPQRRSADNAARLIDAATRLVREKGMAGVRLYLPSGAKWAANEASKYGFTLSRFYHAMLRSASQPLDAASPVDGVTIRGLRAGEEPALLAALNRAWDGTWNFRPIALDALNHDLAGQRAGFLVAVPRNADQHIVGTVHAILDPNAANPDGAVYAWISNLTTAPEWRGRGLGRALLATGVGLLHAWGASSVAIGVDGGSPAPIALYQSVGFAAFGRLDIWERSGADHTAVALENSAK